MNGSQSYNRRHYGVNRLYVGVDSNGRCESVLAYTAKEAAAELRKRGFKPVKVKRG